MSTALIIGSEGQDGTLLKQLLIRKDYKVYGLGRTGRRDKEGLEQYIQFDLANGDYKVAAALIRNIAPREIYYIAAHHHSSQEKSAEDQLSFVEQSTSVNLLGFIKILEIVSQHVPQARVFYASSSLVFSGCGVLVQTEDTTPEPRDIYAVTKSGAMEAAKYYRTAKGIFVAVGILYNHESILRKENFLSKKIINETKELVAGRRASIKVGDLGSVTDWGYAPDYVKAMWHIVQLNKPDVFIISSGKGHAVQNWFEILFGHLKLDWTQFVTEDRSLLTRSKPALIGDNRKLLSTGWVPETSFSEMVVRMYNNQL